MHVFVNKNWLEAYSVPGDIVINEFPASRSLYSRGGDR